MSKVSLLIVLLLCGMVLSCGEDPAEDGLDYTLSIIGEKKEFHLGEEIQAQLTGAGPAVDSIVYYLGEQRLQKTLPKEDLRYSFQYEKLGKWNLSARIYTGKDYEEVSSEIVLYNDKAPVTYAYERTGRFPHATDAYTQGLEFHQGILYESTGHYGRSSLRKVDLQSGEVLKKIDIPATYFAEGITILDGKIYQLTWKEDIGFIYDLEDFEKIGEFAYGQSKEGWGLANDGQRLYKSDGTEKIWILDPEELAEQSFIQTVTNRTIATQLNELEWVSGRLYANTYQKDGVAIINPENGAVEGVINFQGLREELGNVEELDPVNDVLNGIAYDPQTQKLYVTGKDWDTLFEVRIIPE